MKPIIIGIAGGSCSCKTTLARRVQSALGDDVCTIIAQDNYYIDVRTLCPDGGLPNFDAPSSLEFSLLAKHLGEIKEGRAVDIPTYDFTVHQRTNETLSIIPKPVIIVEGILILTQADIRAQLDHSLFMDCPMETRLERRVARDVAERGRTMESVIAQFYETVEPSQREFVDPSARHVDRVLSQEAYISGGDEIVSELIEQWTGRQI